MLQKYDMQDVHNRYKCSHVISAGHNHIIHTRGHILPDATADMAFAEYDHSGGKKAIIKLWELCLVFLVW